MYQVIGEEAVVAQFVKDYLISREVGAAVGVFADEAVAGELERRLGEGVGVGTQRQVADRGDGEYELPARKGFYYSLEGGEDLLLAEPAVDEVRGGQLQAVGDYRAAGDMLPHPGGP